MNRSGPLPPRDRGRQLVGERVVRHGDELERLIGVRRVPARRAVRSSASRSAPLYACHSTTPCGVAARGERQRRTQPASQPRLGRAVEQVDRAADRARPGRCRRGAARRRASVRTVSGPAAESTCSTISAPSTSRIATSPDSATSSPTLVERQPLGPDPDDDAIDARSRAAARARGRAGSRSPGRARLRDRRSREVGGEEVHRRRAEEPGDEAIRRPLVDLDRRADLLDHAVLQARRSDRRASSPRSDRA